MVVAASAHALTGARILEIGGGFGTIQAELVDAGARSGEVIELVAAYEPFARELTTFRRESGCRSSRGRE